MPDWNAELFVKLYSKMALALGVTPADEANGDVELLQMLGTEEIPRPDWSASGKSDTQYLLAIYNPGQYIPAQMDPVNKVDDSYALSVLLDVVPQFSWVFKPAATTISNSYESVLKYKEVPEVSLTPDQKTKLDAASKYYEDNQEKYFTYMDKYIVALDAYDSAKATQINDGPPIPTSIKLKLKAALDAWKAAGHKEGVESAVAVIAQYEALEPSSFWYKLQERYATGTQETTSSSPFQVVGYSPPYKSWFENAGWTSFTFNQKDMDNQKNSEVMAISGELDGNFGIFAISGSGEYLKEKTYEKIDQTELEFSCELMRISLNRNWMNPLLFASRAWRWAKGTPVYGMKFSTGADLEGDIAPQGTMTVIPTAAILSRNMRVKGSFTDTIVKTLHEKIDVKASVGIGPFTIAGRFNMEGYDGSEVGTIATNGIEAKDVQIVALVCAVLPECPDPDPTLKWPSD